MIGDKELIEKLGERNEKLDVVLEEAKQLRESFVQDLLFAQRLGIPINEMLLKKSSQIEILNWFVGKFEEKVVEKVSTDKV